MALTREQALSLVVTLEGELLNRQGWTDLADEYYRGMHPLRFASEEFAGYFADRYHGFADNWVPVVADSPVERLTVQGFQPSGGEVDAEMERVWQWNNLDCDSQLGFQAAVLAGRSHVLVWGDRDNPDTPCVTFEDASQAVVMYEPGSRYKRRAALKEWQDGDSMFATLYTADEVWKFERPVRRIEKSVQAIAFDEEADQWLPRDVAEPNPQPNPMGVVPMVELPNRPMLWGEPLSDVAPVIPLQDAVNLMWAELFTASDFAALPQRYVIGADRPTIPLFDESGRKVGEEPVDLADMKWKRLFWAEGEGATVGSWPAANLDAYGSVIETAIGHLAAQTRTPQHYLIGKMANLSSDALIAAEAGLVKRTTEKQTWFGAALREVARLVCLAQGNRAKADAYRAGRVLWADTESRSRTQLVAALVQLKSVGWPFEDIARQYGLTPQEVADLMKMRDAESQLDPMLAMLGTGQAAQAPVQGDLPGVRPSSVPEEPVAPVA